MATEAPSSTSAAFDAQNQTVPAQLESQSEPQKAIQTIILDSTPLITSVPSLSVLRAEAHTLLTTPAVIAELRDPETRTRFETLYKSFVEIRMPKRESVEAVTEFARKSGDLGVLSVTDLRLLALAWEIDVEASGGASEVRRVPGEKAGSAGVQKKETENKNKSGQERHLSGQRKQSSFENGFDVQPPEDDNPGNRASEETTQKSLKDPSTSNEEYHEENVATSGMESLTLKDDLRSVHPSTDTANRPLQAQNIQKQSSNNASDQSSQYPPSSSSRPEDGLESSSSSDSEGGWITPSNLSRRQAKDRQKTLGNATSPLDPSNALAVAILTQDFAMQNVALQINLNILSSGSSSSLSPKISASSLHRINYRKSFTLRCHACFWKYHPKHNPDAPPGQKKDDLSTKQFCPRCGGATLTRVSYTIDRRTGEFKIHLKKDFQWNLRGQRYSVPKPVAGSASGNAGPGKQGAKGKGGKRKRGGGGKNGWGQHLIYAEDQKEYVRTMEEKDRMGRRRVKDLMDGDVAPGILSGNRDGAFDAGGKPKIGMGRNVNGTRRR